MNNYPRLKRLIALAAPIVFSISLIFPIAAGIADIQGHLPSWWGPVDIGIAFFLGALVIVMMALGGNQVSQEAQISTYRAYRALVHVIMVMLLLFFVCGDRIIWIQCLTGFAWRAWLLLYTLPLWFTAMRS